MSPTVKSTLSGMIRPSASVLAAALALSAFPCAEVFSQEADWASRVRALIETSRFEQAMGLIDEWLKAYPQDLDARGWHARVQAWTNHWREAEAEYRDLLRQTPADADLLAGLADVLTWQNRFREALPLLEQACRLAPDRNDCRLRLARVQQQLGYSRDARLNYQEILVRDSGSRDAQMGLAQLREEGRNEVRFGFDADWLNYSRNAGTITASLQSRWNQRWSSNASFSQYRRFGENATRLDADATMRFGAKNALTVGGAAARDAGIIPKAEARFEYDRGLDLSTHGPFRGLEALYQQRWIWYQGARLLVLSPGAIIYLPNDWNWLVRLSVTNSHYSSVQSAWQPGGWTRLTFPVTHRVTAHVLFAVGAEDYASIDQIYALAARTWGGGLRMRLTSGQEISTYAHYQNRSRGQAETSLGISYAYRF